MTPNIKATVQSLAPGAVIELYELDLSRFNVPTLYFHAGTNELNSDIVWRGQTYVRFPIKSTGWEMKSQGTLPRPQFTASNVTGIMSALCREYNDLVGARVVRHRTLARYLDAVNFPNGNPSADPNEEFTPDIYFVNQKMSESKDIVEWELASSFDVEGKQLPGRFAQRTLCPWRYRGGDCGYMGPNNYDINNNPTDAANDTCPKTLTACKIRFQSWMGPGAWIRFGGFASLGAYR